MYVLTDDNNYASFDDINGLNTAVNVIPGVITPLSLGIPLI